MFYISEYDLVTLPVFNGVTFMMLQCYRTISYAYVAVDKYAVNLVFSPNDGCVVVSNDEFVAVL